MALLAAGLLAGCGRRAGPAEGGSPGANRILDAVNGARFSTAETAIEAGPAGYSSTILKLQVLLDRAHFSPGVIDGLFNDATRAALKAFEQANSLPADGVLDRAAWNRLLGLDEAAALKTYVIDPADVAGPFVAFVPPSFQAMSLMDSLSYRNPAEALGETFHITPALLQALNPGVDLSAPGASVIVPERGSDDLGADIALVEVDRAASQVRAYGADQRLLAVYPATVGSQKRPAPVGRATVRSVMAQPVYRWQTDDAAIGQGLESRAGEVSPGPNNPVGPVWIEVEPGGYGLHGTPEPADVGKPVSHGGVRLTNWDARELARGVREGTAVIFR